VAKKGSYIGGHTTINTMTSDRATYLNRRMYKHIEQQKAEKQAIIEKVGNDSILIKKELKALREKKADEYDKIWREKEEKRRLEDLKTYEEYKKRQEKLKDHRGRG